MNTGKIPHYSGFYPGKAVPMNTHETQKTAHQSHHPDNPDIFPENAPEILPVYHRCLKCHDLGKTCTGKKLTEIGNSESVRKYHRELRIEKKIKFSAIYAAAPQIGHGTIDDYFGRGSQDFKWTTVCAVDNALIAIIGDRVGLPPLENLCPADVADLRNRNESLASRLDESEAEIARLTETLKTAESSHIAQMMEQRTVLQSQIDFAVERMHEAEKRAEDYLARNDEKSRRLDELRAEIRQLNAQIIKITGDNAAEVKSLVDRFIRMTDLHAAEIKAITERGK